MPFCRNGQVILCTWTATTGFVPPPNVGPDGSSRRSYPASPHQYVVCGPDTRGQRQLGGRWDCHTLCPDIGAGALVSGLRPLHHKLPGWLPAAWCRGHWLQLPLDSRPSIPLYQQASLAARLAPVRGIGANCVPPRRALPRAQSAACHSQSTPPSSSHSSTMTDHTWFNTPDSAHS